MAAQEIQPSRAATAQKELPVATVAGTDVLPTVGSTHEIDIEQSADDSFTSPEAF